METSEPRPGIKTTELWGKIFVQGILLANALFGLGIAINDDVALAIVGLMETVYSISRALAKRAGATQAMAILPESLDTLARSVAALNAAVATLSPPPPPAQSTAEPIKDRTP